MLHNVRIFVRVVETGSFTAVANELNTTTGKISRTVTALEEHLSAALIHRTTRHLSMTDTGDRYYRRMKAILADIDHANAEARNATTIPHGRIRIHSMPGLAESHMTAAIVAFQAANPDVSVELRVEQRMPNLVEEGYDVSFIAAPKLPDSGYVSSLFGKSYGILVASGDYLARRGVPKDIADLKKHTLLRLESPVGPTDEWILEGPDGEVSVPVAVSPFQANSARALTYSLLSGAGIGTLASYTVVSDLRSGALVRVLPQYRLHAFNIVALYPARRYLDAKVAQLIDYLKDHISPALDELHRTIEAIGGEPAGSGAHGATVLRHVTPGAA
ncbi:HTH-type transcriptional regulator DmlR [Paraburkholderia humisilvae]|uniref:HTH-type transcriptional regulator DmlR n=2 Tax=Paraburkholderia humisilvae TaxID=627669 RepID=A0A6J5EWP1_9BURK|nr:LysR family transcriptional regulator [Paraburkholderia humisilvae]CAB3769612.1 HTH-type transcriptional regulator DmlR [Paraburkholderia humisilvae]